LKNKIIKWQKNKCDWFSMQENQEKQHINSTWVFFFKLKELFSLKFNEMIKLILT